MIGWIIKLAMWFAPILIRFIDKHSDTWLENTYKKIEKFLGKQAIETTLIFVDKNGNLIRDVRLEFEDDTHGKVSPPQDPWPDRGDHDERRDHHPQGQRTHGG